MGRAAAHASCTRIRLITLFSLVTAHVVWLPFLLTSVAGRALSYPAFTSLPPCPGCRTRRRAVVALLLLFHPLVVLYVVPCFPLAGTATDTVARSRICRESGAMRAGTFQ